MDRHPIWNSVRLTPFRFVSHITQYGGFLPDLPGAHACWYYCRNAIRNLKLYDQGADYEGEQDLQNMINNLARSTAILYRLDSPDDFLQFMPFVKAEAVTRMELEWDDRIERPGTQR